MYKAFISYSHAADGKLAPALQSALECFAKPWYKVRCFSVFRDEASLSASPHLWSNIQQALAQSEFLIYLASPTSAASKWVQKEIEFWVKNKSVDTLLIVLTEGEILWDDQHQSFLNAASNSLPDVLDNIFSEEPFYIDLRQVKTQEDLSLHNPIFKKEVLKLAAPLHAKEPKDLASEEVTVHRKTMRIRNAAISLLALLFVAACGAAWLANENKKEAIKERDRAQANYLISEAKGVVENNPSLALRLAEEAMRISKDSNMALAAQKIYREHTFQEIHDLKNYEGSDDDALAVAFSPDGNTLLVSVWDILNKGSVRLLNKSGSVLQLLSKDDLASGFTSVAFSPDGKHVVAGAMDGLLRVWNLGNNSLQVFKGHTDGITAVAFSPDGATLLSGSLDHTARLWNLQGNVLHVFDGHTAAVNSVAFSPDGKSVLTGSEDQTARWCDLQGNIIRVLQGHKGGVKCACFSPDGKTIFTGADIRGTNNAAARLWDSDGNIRQEFNNHYGTIYSAAFSPDGKTILIGSDDDISAAGTGHCARMWDVHGNLIKEYKNLHRRVRSIAFSPDGQTILVGAGFLNFLDAPLPLATFLQSNKLEPLSPEQKLKYGIK